MKRSDPSSRRFLQYVTMLRTRLLILVRDGKTGQIVVRPPSKHCWLTRSKGGLGRASKQEYNVHTFVGEEFFEQMDAKRNWCFSFTDYYDVYIWDFDPGISYLETHEILLEVRN